MFVFSIVDAEEAARAVELEVDAVAQLDVVAVVVLFDLHDFRPFIVGGNVLADLFHHKDVRHRLMTAVNLFPFPLAVELDLGSVG